MPEAAPPPHFEIRVLATPKGLVCEPCDQLLKEAEGMQNADVSVVVVHPEEGSTQSEAIFGVHDPGVYPVVVVKGPCGESRSVGYKPGQLKEMLGEVNACQTPSPEN